MEIDHLITKTMPSLSSQPSGWISFNPYKFCEIFSYGPSIDKTTKEFDHLKAN